MKVKALNRKVIGNSRNGLPYPPDSLEGICWARRHGKLDEKKALERILNERIEIDQGIKIESHLLLEILWEGPDRFGKFSKIIKLEDSRKLTLTLVFPRMRGGEWLPKEFPGKFTGSGIQRILVAPEPGTYDHGEGKGNPRVRSCCTYCEMPTTEMWLLATLTEVITTSLEPKGLILHCGHFQIVPI